jgi:hypothetical protein
MVFAKEQRTEDDVLVDRLTERPAARRQGLSRTSRRPYLGR